MLINNYTQYSNQDINPKHNLLASYRKNTKINFFKIIKSKTSDEYQETPLWSSSGG